MKKINWSSIGRHLWYEGVIALLILPNALPVALYYLFSIYHVFVPMNDPAWSLAYLFAAVAGVAIDIGIVRIATGKPTSSTWWKSLNLWVPVVFWFMVCLILYDYYSNHTWAWSMTTFTHLAYPTASMFAALYWTRSTNWESEVTAPFKSEIESLAIQLSEWQATVKERVAELTAQLSGEVAQLKNEAIRLKLEVQSSIEREATTKRQAEELKSSSSGFISDLQTQLQKKLDKAYNEIQSLNSELDKARLAESDTFRFMTAREAIRHFIQADPDLTPDELAVKLRVPDDQRQSFRTQVSQVRRELKDTAISA